MMKWAHSFITACGISLAASLVPQAALADFIDGNTLRLYCNSGSPQDEAVCIVYITGAVDAFTTAELIAQKTNGQEPGLCLPKEADPDALTSITRAWLDRRETNLAFAATLLILAAVDDAYGCDKAK